MNTKQILGVVCLAVGTILLGVAWRASNAPVERLSDALTGHYTNPTMWYLTLGVAAVVGGALLAIAGKRAT